MPTPNKIIIYNQVIDDTIKFLRKQGLKGLEGRVYWVGTVKDAIPEVTKVIIPEQIARKSALGVSVTVTQQANLKVTRELKPGEFIIAKVHSHPGRAYNSLTDKENPFLRHEGAVSIIVPNFGRNGMNNLANCAVCIFQDGNWRDLSNIEIQSIFKFCQGG